jgi:3-dehydroquinate synthase
LTQRQIRNGLAEIVKYGVIADKKLFHYVSKKLDQLLRLDPKVLAQVVEQSSRIKTKVVVADEKDTKGIRAILNFGHTIGHALETAGQYNQIHHGEAVALGMRIEAHISLQKKICTQKDVFALNELLSRIQLPERIRKIRTADILRLMTHDKKFLAGKNRFVLLSRIGRVRLVEGVPSSMIKKAIQAYR